MGIVAAAATLAFALRGPQPLARAKTLAKRMVGYPAWRHRAAARSDEPPFGHLAASQVGYAPSIRKQFTSPRRFAAFQVVREDGAIVFRGGPPSREVRTELLGDLRTVWIGDFSALAAPGGTASCRTTASPASRSTSGRTCSTPPIRAVQRALYFQRAFTAIDGAHAEGPWTHPSDAHLAPPGEAKGWHDAGDLSIYSASAASTLFWLLEAYSDFAPAADDTNIPESGNGVPDLLDEARWGLEWMLSVQEPSGGFRNTTCQEQYGRYGTNRPESVPPVPLG